MIAVGLYLAGSWHWLHQRGVPPLAATALVLLTVLQAGTVSVLMKPGLSLWLMLAVASLSISSVSLAETENIRRIIAVGLSLSFIQLIWPLGSLIALGMLPALFALRRPDGERGQATGFYSMILFAPVTTACLLAWFARHGPFTLLAAMPSRPLGMREVFLPLAISAPAWTLIRHGRGPDVAWRSGLAVLAGGTAAALFRIETSPAEFEAVATPLTLLGVAAGGETSLRPRLAAGIAALVLSWTLPMLAGR